MSNDLSTSVANPGSRPPALRRATSAIENARLTTAASVAAPLVICAILGLVLYAGRSASGIFTWEVAATYVLFAASVKFVFAVSGVFSFGQAAAFGGGAYAVALWGRANFGGIEAVLLSALVAAGICFIIALGLFRTSGMGFAMVTLAAGEVLYQLTFQLHTLGGENGLPGVLPGKAFGADLTNQHDLWWYVFLFTGVGLTVLIFLERSQLGATLRSVRDNPVLAEATGVPVIRARMIAFCVAGFFGGLAGALLAQVQLSVTPDLLDFSVSGTVIAMCLIGGTPWFIGPPLGAVIYIWGQQWLADSGQNVLLYTGLAFLAVVLFAPDGLVGLAAQGSALLGRLYRRRRDPDEGSS
jgi:branched-chain amino acid transport system permease protein